MKDYSIYKFAIKQILEGKPANKIPNFRKELMEKLGISNVWLSRIINARLKSKIKLEHEQLIKIADILKVKIDDLITLQCRSAIIKSEPIKKTVQTAA